MPFGHECEYPDFDACLADQQDKGHSSDEARRICGKLQADTEGKCASRGEAMSEILLYGVIGEDVMPDQVRAELAAADRSEELVVRIDSPGGVVWHGLSLYQAFASYDGPKRAVIESSAFSIASYIAMAFDRIEIADNGYMMIHSPVMDSVGDEEQKLKDSALLGKLKNSMVDAYSRRSGIPPTEVEQLMKAESYLNARESLEMGFATDILAQSIRSGILAKQQSMPPKVLASLSSGAPRGDKVAPKEQPMAEQTVATVTDIKSQFPKASSDFIVRCLERKLPIASVASAAAEELTAENEQLKAENDELKAKIASMEEEHAKAKSQEEEEQEKAKTAEEEAKAKAQEEEEEQSQAKAKARGNQPIASKGGGPPKANATQRWNEAISACVKEGMSRARAVRKADELNPGLREEMIEEANAK